MNNSYILVWYKINDEIYPFCERNRRACKIRAKEKALEHGTTEISEHSMQTQSEFMNEVIK